MSTEFIRVYRTEHGDVTDIVLEVHLKYPDLYPAYIEPIADVIVPDPVPEATEIVPLVHTKIKKGGK